MQQLGEEIKFPVDNGLGCFIIAPLLLITGNIVLSPLLSFIATVQKWQSCSIDPYKTGSFALIFNDGGTSKMTEQEADKIDSRLWTALCHLTATQPSPRLIPILLSLTVEQWLGLFPSYPDPIDNRRYVITRFNSVEEDNPTRSTLTIKLGFASIQSVNMIEVVTGKHIATSSMSYAWFEAHFPGSIGRMKSARQLGMQSKEQAHFMVHGVAPKAETLVLPEDLLWCDE